MSQWDKLIADIIATDKNLRFDELAKALRKIGYSQSQPKGGSSHYTFRKKGCTSITLAKTKGMHMDIVYIRIVKDAVDSFLANEGEENG